MLGRTFTLEMHKVLSLNHGYECTYNMRKTTQPRAAPADLSHTHTLHMQSKAIGGKKRTSTQQGSSVDHFALQPSSQQRDGVAKPCDAYAVLVLYTSAKK